jgi:hypothetical protein
LNLCAFILQPSLPFLEDGRLLNVEHNFIVV